MNTGKLIRTTLVILPLGLFSLGMAAVIFTHFLPESRRQSQDEHRDKQIEAAGLRRKPINQIDLRMYVETLAERIGERHLGKYESLNKVAIWVESTLGPANTGYPVRRQAFDVDKDRGKVWNVIAELPGRSKSDEIIVVGAHYDSVPGSPAANGNGSGVAALIALARAFAGDQQERTIQFVAFVNGEPPYFQTKRMGSFVFSTEARHAEADVVAMLSLDSLGFFSEEEGSQQIPAGLEDVFSAKGDFVAFLGNPASTKLAETVRSAFFRASTMPTVAGGFSEKIATASASDHWAFWQNDYPAIVITDTGANRDPHAGKPTDTPENLNYEKLTSVVQGLKEAIEILANP